MRRNVLWTVLIVVAIPSGPAFATNIYFLPGDAFFAFRVSDKSIGQLADNKPPVVKYSRPTTSAFFCGYAGFAELELPKLSAEMKQSLVAEFARHQKAAKRKAEEQKKNKKKVRNDFFTPSEPEGLTVLVYNADYDWQRHGLGIQYNEDWVEDSARFGLVGDHCRLESYVSGTQTIIKAWRDSRKIPRLAAITPKTPARVRGAFSKSPVRLKGEIQLIVFSGIDFDGMNAKKPGARVTVISANGTKTWVTRKRRWVAANQQ